jgi:PAS domain S-box-containing protein
LSGIHQDITDRKEAQNELKRRKEMFESLFFDSPEAIAMIDCEGRIQKINKSYEELFGYSEEELLGKDLLKHQLPEERYDEKDEIYRNVFSNEGTSKYYEDQRITKNGELKNVLVGALPVLIDGEPIAAFGIYTDITKLRKAEGNLKHSLKEKEILLSEIHHRVKNNLAIISGLLELKAMDYNSNGQEEVLDVLNESMLRIKSIAMIHEQLYESEDFANLEFEGYIKDLVDLIFRTLNIEEKKIELDIDCENLEININQAIPVALVINELVSNSFEHGFSGLEGGKLTVEMKHKDQEVNMLVSDNGVGLPDNFDVADSSTLGLTMVRQLIKQLNGELEVTNNNGAQFEIKFPIEMKSGSGSNYFV